MSPKKNQKLIHAFQKASGEYFAVTINAKGKFKLLKGDLQNLQEVQIMDVVMMLDGGTKILVSSEGVLIIPSPILMADDKLFDGRIVKKDNATWEAVDLKDVNDLLTVLKEAEDLKQVDDFDTVAKVVQKKIAKSNKPKR